MEIKIKKRLKLILIIVTIVIIIILPSLIYRAYIVLSNPDMAIYTHYNSIFMASSYIGADGKARVAIHLPYEKGRAFIDRSYEFPVTVAVIFLDDLIDVGYDAEYKHITEMDELEQYGVNPRHADIVYGDDCIGYPKLLITSDGSQFVIYQKYNKVYLHVVEE